MALKLDAIKKAMEDVVTLEVATLTNPLNTDLDITGNDNANIFTNIKSSLNKSSLVAYSRFELDGDAVNFINQQESLASLVEKHAVFVSSAIETRKALFDSIYKAVKEIVDKL